MKEIVRAEHAGFCFGVKRAVNAIEENLKNGVVWTIGLPIHNPQEVGRLRELGLRVAENADEVPAGARVLIRAHGEPRAVLDALTSRGVEVVDMTCPFVKRAQDLAAALSSEGYHVILLGDKKHPEIQGIMGHVDGPLTVVADESEAEKLAHFRRAALISQTTQREERLAAVAGVLVRRSAELHVCNTICRATVERQDAVRRLQADGVVLIGGRASANTAKLRDVAGSPVLWVEDASELEPGWFEGKNRIGIAAGASTPEWLITDICTKIATM